MPENWQGKAACPNMDKPTKQPIDCAQQWRMNEKSQIPASAFQFLAKAAIQPNGGDSLAKSERTLTGVAYGGGKVTDSGWWDNLVLDLGSITIETPIPLLSFHAHDESIGIVTDASTVGNKLSISARLFADIDDDAAEIAAKADKGFPWQLSVGIYPQSIEEILPDANILLNGTVFQGPLTIFRNARIREVSVVSIGADNKTTATILSADIPRITHTQTQAANMPEIDELKTKLAESEAKAAELSAKIVELSAATPDPAKYAPVDALTAMQTELSALRASEQARTIDGIINPALADGRLMAAHEKWARELGATNLKALQDFISMAQPLAALRGTQTGGRSPVGDRKATDDPEQLVTLAAKYQAEQKALGFEVDDITAIQHVSKGVQS
jgi:hypothetical protein